MEYIFNRSLTAAVAPAITSIVGSLLRFIVIGVRVTLTRDLDGAGLSRGMGRGGSSRRLVTLRTSLWSVTSLDLLLGRSGHWSGLWIMDSQVPPGASVGRASTSRMAPASASVSG